MRMVNPEGGVRGKVAALFAELVGERTRRLHGIGAAIAAALEEEFEPQQPADIAFHLTDWGDEAAFILSVQLYPERFTAEEIREGVQSFVIHAPNHIAAAAHLSGWPLRDVFGVGLELDK
jgi:pimeloyl-ACP methyl ester carboxylesterase